MTDPLTTNWSASKLKTASECMYEFYIKYVKKVKGVMSVPLAAGLYIHSGSEKFNNPNKKRTNFKSAQTYANSRVGSWKRCIASIGKYAGQDIIEKFDGEIWAAAQGIVEPCSRHFFENFSGRERPISSEKKFNIQIGDYRLNGGIDYIDPKLVFGDFKTGWGENPPSEETIRNDYQFTIYAAALPIILANNPELAEKSQLNSSQKRALIKNPLDLMEEVEGRYFHLKSGEYVTGRKTPHDLVELLNTIESIAIRVEQEDFSHSRAWGCNRCLVNEVCYKDRDKKVILVPENSDRKGNLLLFPKRRTMQIHQVVPDNLELLANLRREKEKPRTDQPLLFLDDDTMSA